MPPRPDAIAFAASVHRLQLLSILLLGFSFGVTACGLLRLGTMTVIACVAVQILALDKLRVFVASLGNRR